MTRCSFCGGKSLYSCDSCEINHYCSHLCFIFSKHNKRCIGGKPELWSDSPPLSPSSTPTLSPPTARAELYLTKEVFLKHGNTTYHLEEILGEGTFGKVYKLCSDEMLDCDLVVKLVYVAENIITVDDRLKFSMPFKNEFERELQIATWAGTNDVGPEVFYAVVVPVQNWHHEELRLPINLQYLGVLVMRRWDNSLFGLKQKLWIPGRGTGRKIEKTNALFVRDEVFSKCKQMWEVGFTHADLNPRNVLVNVDENDLIVDVALVDFGYSFHKSYPLRIDDARTILEYQFSVRGYSSTWFPKIPFGEMPSLFDRWGSEAQSVITLSEIVDFPMILDVWFNVFLHLMNTEKKDMKTIFDKILEDIEYVLFRPHNPII